MFESICLCTALLRSRHSILMELICSFFIHPDADLLVSSGPLFCNTVQFYPFLNWWTDDLTSVSKIFWYIVTFITVSITARYPDPMAAKQTQILTAGINCLWWYSVWFLPNTVLCKITKHFYLHLISVENIVTKHL